MVNLIDMTEMLRPFFWLMVGIAALAPVAIALGRRFDDLALESEAVEWGPSLFRVPGRLPITFRTLKALAS